MNLRHYHYEVNILRGATQQRMIMMKLKRNLALTLLLGISATLLSSCAGYTTPGHHGNPSNWGNYKCVAKSKNGGHFKGWSTSHSGAKQNAMSKCHAHGGTNCHIVSCIG